MWQLHWQYLFNQIGLWIKMLETNSIKRINRLFFILLNKIETNRNGFWFHFFLLRDKTFTLVLHMWSCDRSLVKEKLIELLWIRTFVEPIRYDWLKSIGKWNVLLNLDSIRFQIAFELHCKLINCQSIS